MAKKSAPPRAPSKPARLRTRIRRGYREYLDPKTGQWRTTHRRVLEKKIGAKAKTFVVHHRDGDRLNNRPANLVGLSGPMHTRIHQEPAACFRCGRTSHRAARCRAKTDYQGRPL